MRVLSICVVLAAAGLNGCGGSSAPAPEPPREVAANYRHPFATRKVSHAEVPSADVPRPVELAAAAATAQVEPSNHSAVIRSYLAKHFIFEDWYRKVHAIVLGDYIATILTSLPADNKGKITAMTICHVVLGAKRAEKVVVLYGRRSSLVC